MINIDKLKYSWEEKIVSFIKKFRFHTPNTDGSIFYYNNDLFFIYTPHSQSLDISTDLWDYISDQYTCNLQDFPWLDKSNQKIAKKLFELAFGFKIKHIE